jgi:hypothetical protein
VHHRDAILAVYAMEQLAHARREILALRGQVTARV